MAGQGRGGREAAPIGAGQSDCVLCKRVPELIPSFVHVGPSKKSAEILAAKMNKKTAFENAPQSTISVRADTFVAPIPVMLVSRWVFGRAHVHVHERRIRHGLPYS